MDFSGAGASGRPGPMGPPSGPPGLPLTTPEPVAYAHDELTGVAQSDVADRQQCYVRYGSMPDANHGASEWRQAESARYALVSGMGFGPAQPVAKPQLPVSVSMRLTRAPAAYAYPIVQRKPFKPPFTLRMTVQYQRQFAMVMSVEAHVMTDLAHGKPQHWSPESSSNDKHSELDNARIQRQLKAGAPQTQLDDTSQLSTIVEDFEFSDLKYVKSSRMNKRWLVFSCRIEADLIYIMYTLPTVIISRRTDQYEKAYETLMGHPPTMLKKLRVNRNVDNPEKSRLGWREDGEEDHGQLSMVNATRARQYILERYVQFQFSRALDDQDLNHLVARAGISNDGEVAAVSDEWMAFRDWFNKSLKALQEVAEAWNQDSPPWICSFAIGRNEAEQLLKSLPQGAFLIRVCSEPGSFAISCKMVQFPNTAFVDHLLVDTVDLHKHPLEHYVWTHAAAKQLYDPNTHDLIPKEEVFRTLRTVDQGEHHDFNRLSFMQGFSSLPAMQGLAGLGSLPGMQGMQGLPTASHAPVSVPSLSQGAGPPLGNVGANPMAPESLFSSYIGLWASQQPQQQQQQQQHQQASPPRLDPALLQDFLRQYNPPSSQHPYQ